MNTTKKFIFEIEDIPIIIAVELGPMDQIIVPLYIPSVDEIGEFASMTTITEFEKDIKSLLPKKIKNNVVNETINSLSNTIQNHIQRYGRLLPSDMNLYIGETILIMCAVSRALNITVPNEVDKYKLFALLGQRIMNVISK